MMEDEQKKKTIMQYFSWLDSMVKVSNDFAYTDINISLESFILKLLNIVGVGKFENCNSKKINYPYIDLIDEKNNVGIQITSETKASKIKETLDKSFGLKISFFFLTMKYNPKKESYLSYPNFSVEDDVYTFEKIIKIIGDNDEMMDNVIEFLTSSIVLPVDINIFRTKVNGYSMYFKEMILNNIEEVCKNFVPTSITMKCLKHLEEKNLLILIGNPGVGKSFNSKFLVAKYIEKGYKLLYSPNKNLRDILNDYNKNDNFILFIDDIFGSNNINFMDSLSEEEIQYILENKKNNMKIIINSRTSISNEVNEKFEKIGRLQLTHFIIETSKFTNAEKARILIKHLKLSKIPSRCLYSLFEKESIWYSKFPKSKIYQIILHKNFNPRLIEQMTMTDLVRFDDDYFNTFITNLDNPAKIYDKAYELNLSKLERDIMKILYLKSTDRLGYNILVDDVYKILINYGVDEEDFKIAIRKLEQSFISIYEIQGNRYCKFYDPSIMDYCMNKFSNSYDMEKFIDYIENSNELDKLILNKKISSAKVKNKIIELEYHNYDLIGEMGTDIIESDEMKKYIKNSILSNKNTRYFGEERFFDNKYIKDSEFIEKIMKNGNFGIYISFGSFGYSNPQTKIIMDNYSKMNEANKEKIIDSSIFEVNSLIDYEIRDYITDQSCRDDCTLTKLENEYEHIKERIFERLDDEKMDKELLNNIERRIAAFDIDEYKDYIDDVFNDMEKIKEDLNDNLDKDTIETINIVEEYYKTII